jgi:hypothetical protein
VGSTPGQRFRPPSTASSARPLSRRSFQPIALCRVAQFPRIPGIRQRELHAVLAAAERPQKHPTRPKRPPDSRLATWSACGISDIDPTQDGSGPIPRHVELGDLPPLARDGHAMAIFMPAPRGENPAQILHDDRTKTTSRPRAIGRSLPGAVSVQSLTER